MSSEKAMYEPLESYFHSKGFETFREVPLLTRRIDLLGVNHSEIAAVELKVKNWQKALQQALSYRLCANRVYVAVSKVFVHRVNTELFRHYGIGILSVDGDVSPVLEASNSQIIHSSLLGKILEYTDKEKSKKAGR
jgi:hypothetical protein